MKQGQALIEALVAVSVLTVGFLGIVTLLSNSLGLNRVVSDNYTATYLASEGVEVVKNILDKNSPEDWLKGLNSGPFEAAYDSSSLVPYQGRILNFDPTLQFFGYTGANDPPFFKRKITLEVVSGDEVRVNSEVSWITRGGEELKIDVQDHFFNWRKYATE